MKTMADDFGDSESIVDGQMVAVFVLLHVNCVVHFLQMLTPMKIHCSLLDKYVIGIDSGGGKQHKWIIIHNMYSTMYDMPVVYVVPHYYSYMEICLHISEICVNKFPGINLPVLHLALV